MFQEAALYPWLNVIENVMFGLKAAGLPKDSQREIAETYLKMVQLWHYRDYPIHQISGGMRQRTALARALALDSKLLLMDEPFSALDQFLKDRLQQELYDMLEAYKGTVILVSHDRDEIYRFSEELIIMDRGAVVTSGKTKEIFANPGKREAARLTGCKNISRIQRLDAHRMKALDWGVELTLQREIPEDTAYAGFRAH